MSSSESRCVSTSLRTRSNSAAALTQSDGLLERQLFMFTSWATINHTFVKVYHHRWDQTGRFLIYNHQDDTMPTVLKGSSIQMCLKGRFCLITIMFSRQLLNLLEFVNDIHSLHSSTGLHVRYCRIILLKVLYADEMQSYHRPHNPIYDLSKVNSYFPSSICTSWLHNHEVPPFLFTHS